MYFSIAKDSFFQMDNDPMTNTCITNMNKRPSDTNNATNHTAKKSKSSKRTVVYEVEKGNGLVRGEKV